MNGLNHLIHLDTRHSLWALVMLLVTLVVPFVSGCQNFDLKRRIPWKTGKDQQPKTALKIVCTWVDAIRHRPGHPAIRGFGGRIYFFGKDDNKPVKVAGRIVVYAFDETSRNPNSEVPDRKIVFPADQVPKLASKSPLGPSYSVWVPWDEAGGVQKRISLIVRFEPTHGPVIVSAQTTNLLPGRQLAANASAAPGQAGAPTGKTGRKREGAAPVRSAGFLEEQPPGKTTQHKTTPRMTTTTISLRGRSRHAMPTAAPRSPIAEPVRHEPQAAIRVRDPAREALKGLTRAVGTPRAVHSAPGKPPVRATQAFPPRAGRGNWPPRPGVLPSARPLQPRSRFPAPPGWTGESAR